MTIFRVSKDKNNPYVILNKAFFHDPEISLKLKGFLGYCLTLPDDWKFSVHNLSRVLKEGKNSLYRIINEGITHGYIERHNQKKNGRFTSVEYVIHESQIQKNSTVSRNAEVEGQDDEYDLSKSQIQKNSTVSRNPDAESGTLLSTDRLSTEKTEIRSNSKSATSAAPEPRAKSLPGTKVPPPSAKASEISFLLLRKILEMKPDVKRSDTKKWALTIDRMIRLDKRKPENIEKVIEWVYTDDFWRTNILSADKLRKQFDRLELQMTQKASKSPENRIKEVHAWIQSSDKKEALREAKKKNLVDWGREWMEFKGSREGYISFSDPRAVTLIDHWIRKIEQPPRINV